jgi:hypothetical protein
MGKRAPLMPASFEECADVLYGAKLYDRHCLMSAITDGTRFVFTLSNVWELASENLKALGFSAGRIVRSPQRDWDHHQIVAIEVFWLPCIHCKALRSEHIGRRRQCLFMPTSYTDPDERKP